MIRSDKSPTALKQILAGVTLREYVLAKVLEGLASAIFLLDYAPPADILHFAALVAVDYLLIPTHLDKLAVNGVRDALQILAALMQATLSYQLTATTSTLAVADQWQPATSGTIGSSLARGLDSIHSRL